MVEKSLDVIIGSGNRNPYEDRIGTCFIIDDIDTHGKQHRTTGKLAAVFGQNLLFEQKDGCCMLVNPATALRIIELRRP